MENPAQCRALNISDEKHCLEIATSSNGLFCAFHSRQCYGLYRGYKLRNARLDALSANPPPYIASNKTSLANLTFEDVETEDVLKEIHEHLFERLRLLERVIRARKLHMSRFFSQNMDYGHTKYLDALMGQKAAVVKALERLEKRTSEVLYKQQKWFKWVREVQDEEEGKREKEQKKVKQEAAMFRRNWKAAQLRMRDWRAKEDKKRNDAYLEQVYKERMAQKERDGDEEDDGDEMDWDPIEDVLEDSRGSYVDLIQTFLWMQSQTPEEDISQMEITTDTAEPQPTPEDKNDETSVASETPTKPSSPVKPSHSSKKAKSKNKKKPAAKPTGPPPEASSAEPDKNMIESKEEMHARLRNGTEFDREKIKGLVIAGTVENPVMTTKTITFPEPEIERLLGEVSEIKYLLFCRLLLGQVALLPAALRANNVEEFLADPEVTGPALRDLCLKMENPGLQEIRDACADLFRSEDEPDDDDEIPDPKNDTDEKKHLYDKEIFKPKKPKGALPEKWVPKRERAKAPMEEMAERMGMMPDLDSIMDSGPGRGLVNFGENQDAQKSKQKIRVKICGRSIWNYPSDKAMNRGGWLHFCIIAKDSSLNDAVALCRHWDEFFELNVLALWHYFPGANWAEWVGNRYRQQMLQLGFIMYFESAEPDAMELTQHHQQNGRRGQFRRSHAIFEARNFICAHIKRDDQAMRRLVQYLAMQSHRLLLLVRDAETGQLLIKPPEEERWLYREKSGLGRASKNEFHIIKSIGPEFFESIDKYREWNFSFKEYYDIYVWDVTPGESFPALYNCVQEMLFKALRCRSPPDMYNLAGPVLKTLHKDKVTHRVRDIKPGEDVPSVWDSLHAEGLQFFYGEVTDDINESMKRVMDSTNKFPRNLFYNQADTLEDEILFPEERASENLDPSQIGKIEPLRVWEEEGFSLRKFIEGRDWYSEDSDEEEEEDDGSGEEDDEDEEWEDETTSSMDEMDLALEEARLNMTTPPIKPEEFIQKLGFSKELKDAMAKLAIKEGPHVQDRDIMDPKNMEVDFMSFLDKEKARIFKEVWHKADLAPHAQTRYIEMMEMAKKARRYNHHKFDCPGVILGFKLLHDLDVDDTDSKDIHKAIGKMTPFFDPAFLASKDGEPFKDSLMFNQLERLKTLPDCRTHVSNKYRPAEHFKDFDKATKDMEELEDLPFEWDVAIRPIIAHLYKSGVIRTRPDSYTEGQAFAATEPHRPSTYDLFFDWRPAISTITFPPGMEDPFSIAPFKTTALAFSTKHPSARFAVLSLWSAPHFYPLMIGPNNHDATSFRDLIGRCFIWMFVPKDMPCSEYSIHHSAKGRLKGFGFERYFKGRVVVKRDKFLVMGKDEGDLFRLASAVTYAIQRRPWRWEVDLWRSWVNVDFKFLEGMDDRLLE